MFATEMTYSMCMTDASNCESANDAGGVTFPAICSYCGQRFVLGIAEVWGHDFGTGDMLCRHL